jgi:hypothetical protein
VVEAPFEELLDVQANEQLAIHPEVSPKYFPLEEDAGAGAGTPLGQPRSGWDSLRRPGADTAPNGWQAAEICAESDPELATRGGHPSARHFAAEGSVVPYKGRSGRFERGGD